MITKFDKSILKLAVVASLVLASEASMGATIVLGSDYLYTVKATWPGVGDLISRVSGPDTIVQRQADCSASVGGSCTIPIELVGLSLQSLNGNAWVREDPNRSSSGFMDISLLSEANGVASGTFDSFFDVFFQVSLDQGSTWADMESFGFQPSQLSSSGTAWTSIVPDPFKIEGLVGNQTANWHTDKEQHEFDFFPVGIIEESHPSGVLHDVVATPIPPAIFLFGSALLGLLGMRKKPDLAALTQSSNSLIA